MYISLERLPLIIQCPFAANRKERVWRRFYNVAPSGKILFIQTFGCLGACTRQAV